MKAFCKLKVIITACLLVLLFSCKDKFDPITTNSTPYYYRYFPLDAGRYIVYDVDSIIYDLLSNIKIDYHFQIKENTDSSFIDSQGKKAWYVSRYKRANDSASWDFVNVWVTQMDNFSAQRVEDNLRYVKLSFPVRLRKIWNGNAYNPLPEEDYSYS